MSKEFFRGADCSNLFDINDEEVDRREFVVRPESDKLSLSFRAASSISALFVAVRSFLAGAAPAVAGNTAALPN